MDEYEPRSIDYILSTPMNDLCFMDFVNLRVGGCDAYSRMNIAQLCSVLGDEVVRDVVARVGLLTTKPVLRWVARGLPVEKAIRKVKTDDEFRRNVEKSGR